jgi:hypothetical protein
VVYLKILARSHGGWLFVARLRLAGRLGLRMTGQFRGRFRSMRQKYGVRTDHARNR